MDFAKLNENFKTLLKDTTYLEEMSHKEPMPTVTYDVIQNGDSGRSTMPSKVSDMVTNKGGASDPKDQQHLNTNIAPNQKVIKVGGSTAKDGTDGPFDPDGPHDYAQKAAAPVSQNKNIPSQGSQDPKATVPVDVGYGTKMAIFKSSWTLNHMKKESFDISKDVNSLLEGSEMSDELKEQTFVVF